MHYRCHKVNFRRGGSYIDSPDWIKMKKATTNPKKKDAKCFQYAVTVDLNYEETESYPKRVSNIELFINKYNWKGINYPSKIDYRKTFEKNNPTIALNILHIRLDLKICWFAFTRLCFFEYTPPVGKYFFIILRWKR